MTLKDSKLQGGKDLASTTQQVFSQARCWDLMGMISGHLTLALQGWEEMRFHLEALLDASQASQAKPSKKQPRTASKRTSAHRKA